MKMISSLLLLFVATGALLANESELFTNTKPVAVLTSAPNQTWFYNMEDVVFSSSNSYDPDAGDYISQTRYYVNSVLKLDTTGTNGYEVCFALNGSPDGDCIELSAGATTVTVGVRVKDNHGTWSTTVSTTYTIQEHKGRKYFITDHIGNVRATVNRDGNILGYDDYYPFGKVMQANNNANPNDNYKFTGHERDTEASLSIDYMNARTYDPITGVFMQRDPLEAQFPGWTPYHYVHNNPLNLVDPTGMRSTRHASETEDERKPRKVGVEPKGTGWGAVGANLMGRNMIAGTVSSANDSDEDSNENSNQDCPECDGGDEDEEEEGEKKEKIDINDYEVITGTPPIPGGPLNLRSLRSAWAWAKALFKSKKAVKFTVKNADDLVMQLRKQYGGNVTVMKNGKPVFRVHQPGTHGPSTGPATITRFNANINPNSGRTFYNPASNVSPLDADAFGILQQASKGKNGFTLVTRGGR